MAEARPGYEGVPDDAEKARKLMRKRVLIVGGGSSGWMTAAYLDAVLNNAGMKRVDISLIESPDVPRIGVGEATIPSINHILAAIGIDELEFLRRVDGTYKQAIKYVNWLDGKGESYYHAFGRYRSGPVDTTSLDWLMSDRSIPFSETISAQPALCEALFGPKMLGSWDMGSRLTYAFHMNALQFIYNLCESSSVRRDSRNLDDVVDTHMPGFPIAGGT